MNDPMDRYLNMKQREAILLLLHIHDHLWRDRHIPLKARVDGCQEIQNILHQFYLRPEEDRT